MIRFAALLLFLALVAAIDLLRRKPGERRGRDYVLPLLSGVLGAAVGWFNDTQVTAPLSPDYFQLGKGLPAGAGFQGRVARLGLQAGAGAGLLAGAAYVYANRRRRERPSLPLSRLVLQLGKPLGLAVAGGLLFPLAFASFDPLGFRPTLDPLIAPDAVRHFLQVWWIHVGLYAGLLAGLAWGMSTIHRARIRLDEPPALR